LVLGVSTITPATATESPPFVTILFSRSQWGATEFCKVPAGAVTLDHVAGDLAARGWTGTGSVVLSYIKEWGLTCTRGGLYPDWRTLQRLHTQHRWQFVSHSRTYADLTKIPPAQQWAESCGSLPTLRAHGFLRGWGLFAYPNNRFTWSIQQNVVSRCFSFGRRYSDRVNTRAAMVPPRFANAWSVNGGACNLSWLPCFTKNTPYRYVNPWRLVALLQVRPGQWAVVQFYTLVTGSKLTGPTTWDCTSTDWRRHFSSRTEIYCWNDYQTVLRSIPAAAMVTDPATVASSWSASSMARARHR
jgi:hypothetical protein